jgi:ethanolamine utilization cobalamin adenosyltransferase
MRIHFSGLRPSLETMDEPYSCKTKHFQQLGNLEPATCSGKESISPYNTLVVLSSGTLIFNDTQQVGIRRGTSSNPDLKMKRQISWI